MKTMRNRVVGAEESIRLTRNGLAIIYGCGSPTTITFTRARTHNQLSTRDTQYVREVCTERVVERVILSELIKRSYNHVPTPRCRSLESDINTTSDNSYSFENKNSPRSYQPMSRTLGLLRRSKWQTISVLTLF